ncbi:MAG: metalloregulator ArsR/SmtB family transcription factor [Pseudomonadota bacterium]
MDVDSPLSRVLEALRAAAEPTRLRLIAICAAGEWTVTELTQIVGQSQPRVSRHLKVLAEAGLLDRFREGNWVFYRLADRTEGIARRLVDLLPPAPELERDQRRLEDIRAERQRRARVYFDEHAAEWEQVRRMTVADEEVDRALSELLDEERPATMIDIGTGTGHMLEVMASRLRSGLGIDLSLEMLGVARANLEAAGVRNCQLRHGDMYQLPVPDRTFDAAVLHQVLHFAEDPAAVIREAARVLAPGGRLIIVDLRTHGIETLRDSFAHRRLGFGDEEVAAWVTEAGLEFTVAARLGGKVTETVVWVGRGAAAEAALPAPRRAVA